MNRDTTVKRSEDQVSAVVDDEVVVMRLSDGAYVTLHETGNDVWNLLEEPITFGALCDRLVEAYEVDAEVCARDTAGYLEGLREQGIVELVG